MSGSWTLAQHSCEFSLYLQLLFPLLSPCGLPDLTFTLTLDVVT